MDGNSKYDEIVRELPVAPLSTLLPKLLMAGQEAGNEEITKWASLELGGYFQGNSALTSDVVVPEYRTVVGQYVDRYGRPFVITDSRMAFLNEYRVRYSVAELERMENHSGLLAIEDPVFIEMFREKLQVNVDRFYFSPSCICGVISGIRTRLVEHLDQLRPPLQRNSKLSEERHCSPRPVANRWKLIFRKQKTPLGGLHPTVIKTASRLYSDGHYRQAVLDTYIALVERVKEVSGRTDLDNTALMQTVFSPKNPTVVLSDDPDEQMGQMWLFSGAVMGVRNPKAHRLDGLLDAQHTFEWLAFSSALFRLLDQAKLAAPRTSGKDKSRQ